MISKEALKRFAAQGSSDSVNSVKCHAVAGTGISESPERLQQYLVERGLTVKAVKVKGDKHVIILAGCPMNPDHGNGTDTAIVWRPGGQIGFECKHDSCNGHSSPDVRRKLDPAYKQSSVIATTTPASWESPIPLADFDLPEFPIEAIPSNLSVLAEYCKACAESFQVPVDLPAMLALAGAGAALATRIEVHVRGDHHEPVNIFAAIAMAPANRKSSVFAEIAKPLIEYERDLAKQLAPTITANQNERAILEARLREAQNRAAKIQDAGEREQAKREAHELAEQLRQMPILISPRLLADDATPERLAGLLHDHGGRIALLSPEGDTFDLMAGRYGTGGPNLGVYLKGHAGDDLRVDRVGRVSEFIHKPALTIGLAVQPVVLQGLMDRPGFRGKGLLARFLYSIPRSTLGTRKLTPPAIPDALATQYRALLHAALMLERITDADGQPGPRIVKVGAAGLEQLLDFAGRVEVELAPHGEFASLQDWAGKLVGAVARIAGIYHGLTHARTGRPEQYQIDAETILCAITLAEYLIPHAKAAFAEMGADASIEMARRLIEWLKAGHREQFSRREAHRAFQSRLVKASALDDPLRLLVDHGYIRPVEVERKPTGQRPSPVYEVNPEIQ